MKISTRDFRSTTRTRGTVLLAALCFTLILGVLLATYQAMCYYTLKTGDRNAQNNRCIELAETGFEDALWSLNRNDWTGWTLSSGVATKTLSGFNYAGANRGEVQVTINNYDGTHPSTDPRTLIAEGIVHLADGTTVSRRLSVKVDATTPRAPMFTNAIAAIGAGSVNFNPPGSSTGTITVDSFDATEAVPEFKNTAMVTGGSVALSAGTTVKGFVAALPQTSGAISLVAPTGARVVHTTTENSDLQIERTSLSTSPYQNSFDVVAKTAIDLLPSSNGSIGDPANSAPIVYRAENIVLSGANKLTINGPVILVVNGQVTVQDSAQIVVSDAKDTNGKLASSLQIFVKGDLTLKGAGVLNQTQLPRNVSILGTDTGSDPEHPQTFTFDTPTSFYGIAYVPKGNVVISPESNFDFYGSVVAQNISVASNGGAVAFHYDLSLRSLALQGIDTPFEVKNWRDLTSNL